MACDLTAGRAEICKDSVGGLKNIYFTNYDEIEGYTYDVTNTDVIATAFGAATINAFKYELKGANVLDETVTSSRDNGTTFTEQALTVVLKKVDITTHQEMKLLSYGRPRAIIEDLELETMVISSGTVMADLNGYTLTLKGMEKIPANFIDTANEAGLLAVGFTVVS